MQLNLTDCLNNWKTDFKREIPHVGGEGQAEGEDDTENGTHESGGSERKVQLEDKENEKHVGEHYSAQKAEDALQNVVLQASLCPQ